MRILASALVMVWFIGLATARADTPAPNSPITQSAPTALPTVATATQVEHLNPEFVISPDVCQQLIDKGNKEFRDRKTLDDVMSPCRENPEGVIGERGTSHQSFVWFLSADGLPLIESAYSAAANYEPLNISADYKTSGIFLQKGAFHVELSSTPKVARGYFAKGRTASADDVTVTSFVLTDDTGTIIHTTETSSSGLESGSMEFSGVAIIPQMATQTTNSYASGTAYSQYGSVSGQATGTSNSTVIYNSLIPWSESHPYYTATYDIAFPLFDSNGNPLITDHAKSVTLHMIKANGEMDASFDLRPIKP